MLAGQGTGVKRKRVSRACDWCHRRGRKCRRPEVNNEADTAQASCLTCSEYGVSCTWTRIASKRGMKPRQRSIIESQWALNEEKHGSRALLDALIEVFFADVYPIVCTVHEETFRSNWKARLIPQSRGSYAKLMAMCALSAVRIEGGASVVSNEVLKALGAGDLYLHEACSSLPAHCEELRDFEALQALHLIAVTTMERGDAELFHHHMGLYYAAAADQCFSDERRWPVDITMSEREERRRLYWHMYKLEVHTSLIFGHVIRVSERQASVAYPDLPENDGPDPNGDTEWLTGWNYVTDLYRGLEHLIIHFRTQRMPSIRPPAFGSSLDASLRAQLVEELESHFLALPHRFRKASEMSHDIRRNRCGYQVANILCEYHLVKIFSYATDENKFTEACNTVLRLIEDLSAIPVAYLQAMSRAMLQEISGFGHILSSFIGKELSHSEYQQLRTVMLCTAEFLDSLSSCLPSAADDASKLRKYVNEIDQYLRTPLMAPSTVPIANGSLQKHVLDQSDAMMQHMVVPIEYLDRIPWPTDWLLE